MHPFGHVHPGAGFLNLDLVPVVALLCLAALARRGRDASLLLVAAGAMAVAAAGPVHDAAARSVTGHMVQHLILILVVAPTVGVVLATAPGRVRARRALRPIGRAVSHPLAPVVAGTGHAAVLVVWHLPGPYDAAVDSLILHGLEHVTLVATGAWWWATVVHHAARRGVGVATVSLFGVATFGAGMGVFLMFAPNPLYAHGGIGDQQMAGALMAGTGLVYGATGLWTGARAIARLSTPRPARVGVASRGGALLVALSCLSATGALLATTHPVQAQERPPPEATDGDVEPGDLLADGSGTHDPLVVGRELYRRDCASCHAPDGSGSFRGTPLTGVGTASVRYYLDTGRMPIADPDEAIRRRDPRYDPDEIAAITAYLETLIDGLAALDPDADAASVARGGEHYRLHCAACHGAEGIGGALAFQGFAPSLFESTPADVANAMVAGPGVMPAFAATFDDQDIAAIAAYVGHLQDPPRTGIAIPGGRVGEGLVAWLAGLGAILLAVRWMGTRT